MRRLGQSGEETVAVALVAAYPSVRAGLRALLLDEEHIDVVAEVGHLRDLAAETRVEIAVVVIDLDPDGVWGTAGDLFALPAAAGLVLLGPAAGDAQLVEMLGERPWAYLLKDVSGDELARAIEAVASGLVAVQPPLARRLFAPAQNISPVPFTSGGGVTEGEALTAREHEVLQLVAEGLPNKLIALKLGISEHTVKFHITSILSKLDASSRTEAVRLGARRGLIVL